MTNSNTLRSTKPHRTTAHRTAFGLSLLATGLLGIGTLGGCVELDERADDESVRQEGSQPCSFSLAGHDESFHLTIGEEMEVLFMDIEDVGTTLNVTLEGECTVRADGFNVAGFTHRWVDTGEVIPLDQAVDAIIENHENVEIEAFYPAFTTSGCEDNSSCELALSTNGENRMFTVQVEDGGYRAESVHGLVFHATAEELSVEDGDSAGDDPVDGGGDSTDVFTCTEVTAPKFRNDHIDAGAGLGADATWRERVGAWIDVVLKDEVEGNPELRESAITDFCQNDHPYTKDSIYGKDVWESRHGSDNIPGAIGSHDNSPGTWRGEWSKFHGIVKDGEETVGIIVDSSAVKNSDNKINFDKLGHLVSECVANHSSASAPTCISVTKTSDCSGQTKTRCAYDDHYTMETFVTNCGKRTYQLEDIERWGLYERAPGFLWDGDGIRVFSDDTCNSP
ncbi:MAG: hypothetical protein AAGF11_13265 [Myxococcota bacterium]